MCHSRWIGVLFVVVGFTAAGCQTSKSSNPLSPTVAGPIPGVEISAPKPMTPVGGMKVALDQQPVTLTIQNAVSNGPRPLNYSFEVATDAAFTNTVFTRGGVTPGDSKTSVRLPEPLAPERTYYWRSRAEDGANSGPYSAAADFNVATPVVIGAPTLASPANNATVSSVRPKIMFANAPRSGPAGAITYLIELATTDSFATKVASWTMGEQSGQTSADAPQDLGYNTYYFWHVRASDSTTIGPWSPTQAFITPIQPAIPVAPTPIPGAPSGVPDLIDLQQARVFNSFQDVAFWAPTATITRLDLMPSGAHIEFTKQNVWPDVIPPGWTGPIQYTLWIVLKIDGQWVTSGCIEYWRGLYESGGPITQYSQNWYYDPIRWGPMAGHQPAPGEQVGFFVTAGDARNSNALSIKERSNVVVVPFPDAGGGHFGF